MKIIFLKGGLGNQLFQLALYIYLQKKTYSRYDFIEKNIGFFLDYKYKRKYELGVLPNGFKKGNIYNSFFVLILFLIIKLNIKLAKLFHIEYISENNYLPDNSYKKNNRILFFDGYFQNYRIINFVRKELLEIIQSKLVIDPQNEKFINLISRIKRQKNSIALCIRFYEESKDPDIHSNPEKLPKSYADYNKLIKFFENQFSNPHFFIFVQEENQFTNKLIFNSSFEYITHRNGYKGSWNRLYAQSSCLHQIFNNSTFYYWGAFISSSNFENGQIYMSNNFLFKNIYNPNWKTF